MNEYIIVWKKKWNEVPVGRLTFCRDCEYFEVNGDEETVTLYRDRKAKIKEEKEVTL